MSKNDNNFIKDGVYTLDMVQLRRDDVANDSVTEGIYCKLEQRFVDWFLYCFNFYADKADNFDMNWRVKEPQVEFFKFQTSKIGEYYCDVLNGVDKLDLFYSCKKILETKIYELRTSLMFVCELGSNPKDDVTLENMGYIRANKEVIKILLRRIFAEICFSIVPRPITNNHDTSVKWEIIR
jgi:hypothetical protein